MKVELPFPPASLAGHNTGHWRNRDREVATYRAEAMHLTRAAAREQRWKAPEAGDIALAIHFVPPNDRGDRVNYPIRIKAQIDGIAEALGVNDKRFLPSYTFAGPEKPGRVVVEITTYPHPLAEGEIPKKPAIRYKDGPATVLATPCRALTSTLSRSAEE
jgi:hypothetical protein